jgi:putative PIG3 family NAD(P)H quinone oxidoreductase
VYDGAGGTEIIHIKDVPTPEPGERQIRVRVHAAGLNRADLLQRRGHYPVPPGWPVDIPGLEYAGEVASMGPGATRWRIGDRVMGLVGGGAHAEMVVIHEDEAIAVPPGMSVRDAAAIPEAFLTAYDALVVRAHTTPGDRVLIHAVGSGVGTAATQVARRLGAGTVLGTSRTESKLERARAYGLDIGINTASASFRDRMGDPVHVILDVLGGAALADNLAVLAPLGRLVLLGFLGGSSANVDLSPILRKRLTVVGTVMRTRSREERIALVRTFADEMLPGFTDGSLRPVVGAVFPMTDLAHAHEVMERDETFGKVVLEWDRYSALPVADRVSLLGMRRG